MEELNNSFQQQTEKETCITKKITFEKKIYKIQYYNFDSNIVDDKSTESLGNNFFCILIRSEYKFIK